ncbi:dihydroxyacetone kinase [Mycoplasmopsis pullorum]|uniref:DAK2 domain-containing protein n=1 Tax=Mycoplasmopsis pullorum TaxID=48003 RepID=UPI00111B5B31|nr:DAK2 domain-containing protein [Mycoplasmopsis pullorum]TNK83478.1 dihydroxyacetone kinase [Mycoplasmopsis pullorum]TNK92372.1 dihydroxyacetone kinase [Mycoplasmopsis pullorum]
MNNKLNGYEFAKSILSGSNSLSNNKSRIDALNVFPVPDGDTGTNMSSTIGSALSSYKFNEENIEKASNEIAKLMLFGARGNSGVILSQIFRGFANGLIGVESAGTKELLIAFKSAAKKAYSAVLKPIEGTILTVIRETYESLEREFANKEVSTLDFFIKVVEFARISCDNTPNKLKTLREVGVTDSGGEGLYTIFLGMLSYFRGQPIEITNEDLDINKFIQDTEVFDGEFGYCTEFIVDLNDHENFDKNKFTTEVEKIASSLVVVNDENILKVHGHTLRPGDFLNFAQNYGEFLKIKSENMTEQANNSKANAEVLKKANDNIADKVNLCGVVSCNLGNGFIEKMQELGCDYVVEGGQTQNPSAQDIIEAINQVNAQTVFVLPNNSNVFLVSQQAAQVVRDRDVIIIPSKTQIQGVSALINFNKENSAEDNTEMMNEAIEDVLSGEVTQAVRTTKINGVNIQEGDYIAIFEGKIIAAKNDYMSAAQELLKKMIVEKNELISIYYGDLVSETDANELADWIQSQCDAEIEIINGEQPNYHFLIGAE